MDSIKIGVVVMATDWPATKGDRFLVTGIEQHPRSGEIAHLLEFDGGTPFQYRCIPTQNLRIDPRKTREREQRLAWEAAQAEAARA